VTRLGKIRDKIRDQSFFYRQAAKEDKFSDQKIEVFIFLGVLGVLKFFSFEQISPSKAP
jgi:hypothetical protein